MESITNGWKQPAIIWMLTPFSLPQGVSGGIKDHALPEFGGSEMSPQLIGAAAGYKGSPKASRTTPYSASLASLFHFTSTPQHSHIPPVRFIFLSTLSIANPPPPVMTLPSWTTMGQGAGRRSLLRQQLPPLATTSARCARGEANGAARGAPKRLR